MKRPLIIFLLIVVPVYVFAQAGYHVKTYYETSLDKLHSRLQKAKTDTEKLNVLNSLVMSVVFNSDPASIDTGEINQIIRINTRAKLIDDAPYKTFLQAVLACRKNDYVKALDLFKQTETGLNKDNIDVLSLLLQMRWVFNVINKPEDKRIYYTQRLQHYLQTRQYLNAAGCYHSLASYYGFKVDYNSAINNYLKAGELFKPYASFWHNNEILVTGTIYYYWGNNEKAIFYLKKGFELLKRAPVNNDYPFALLSLAQVEYQIQSYPESLKYLDTLHTFEAKNYPGQTDAYFFTLKALNLTALNRLPEAFGALQIAGENQDTSKISRISSVGDYDIEYAFYKYYQASGEPVKAGNYLIAAYHRSLSNAVAGWKLRYLKDLVQFYGAQKNIASAWKYTVLYNQLNDSLQTTSNRYKIASYEIEQKENEQNKKVAGLQQQQAVQDVTISQRNTIIWLSLTGLVAVCIMVVFIYRQLRINKKTLISLQQTQTQLIQSEKMASLGELTAGIAHEIQNPLNFVNNFSEVSMELVDEMGQELDKGDIKEAKAIGIDIKQNLEKIQHHGKRADFIVKGMLQHSRTSTGEKQETNINTLADEFLKLSYHGLRAKDKSFNAELTMHFDDHLPKVNIAQQDIGRVLLNLFNNAFYAVNQKQKTAGADYKPEVTVATSEENGSIIIKVKDNGNGIPDNIKDKIMQPFFTTKPTGEGTGLGLSLSYDIVVKGHGGKIDLNSKEGEGSEFIIQLPINQI